MILGRSTRSREAKKTQPTKRTQFLGRAEVATSRIGRQGRVARSFRNALGFSQSATAMQLIADYFDGLNQHPRVPQQFPRIPAWLDGFAGKPSMLERRMSEVDVITEVIQTPREFVF